MNKTLHLLEQNYYGESANVQTVKLEKCKEKTRNKEGDKWTM